MRTTALSVVLTIAAPACTSHTLLKKTSFPSEPGPYTAPILDPLTASHVQVMVEVERAEEKKTQTFRTNAIIDTGAFRSSLPESAATSLELDVTKNRLVRVSGVTGTSRAWRAAIFPT